MDLREQGLNETATLANAGKSISLHVANIAVRKEVEVLPEAILAHHGQIDAVINNAGIIQPFVRLNNLDYEVIERMINVNLYGTIYINKTFLPHLLERPEAHIANVSSMGGFLPVPGQTMYGAAKAAVKLMTEGLYAELIDTSIGVSVVMPGAVATNIVANSGVNFDYHPEDGAEEKHRAMPADKAARIILDGIEDNDLHILVGSDAYLMNLASRIAPKSATRLIQRQMKDLLDREA